MLHPSTHGQKHRSNLNMMHVRMDEDDCIGEYALYRKLGKGGFGEVYLAKSERNKEFYALKLEIEDKPRSRESIDNEIHAYIDLKGFDGIPMLVDHGVFDGLKYLVIPLFDTTLQVLLETQPEIFTARSAVLIGKRLLKIIEFIHSKGRIYRDFKPDNIAVGRDNKIYLIDFGMSKRYVDEYGKHIPEIRKKSLSGTVCYASINTHRGIEQSRRDDLEGLFYVLIVLLKSSLPWMKVRAATRKERESEVARMKEDTSLRELCDGTKGTGCLVEIINYVRRLEFKETPDYSYINSILDRMLDDIEPGCYSPSFFEECEPNTAANISLWAKFIYIIRTAAFG